MDIDEFLDKETSTFQGKTHLLSQEGLIEKEADENADLFKQIQTVKEQIIKKDLSSAGQEFNILREHYINITKKQLKENQFLFNELLKLNNEIITNMGLQAQQVAKQFEVIRKLLDNAKADLRTNKVDEANKLYTEIKTLVDQIPEIFSEEKNRFNEEMLSFYVLLSKFTDAHNKNKFSLRQIQIRKSIMVAMSHLRAGNLSVVKDEFDKISFMYDNLPEGFAKEKALLYQDILKLFSSVYLIGNRPVQISMPGQAHQASGSMHNQPAASHIQTKNNVLNALGGIREQKASSPATQLSTPSPSSSSPAPHIAPIEHERQEAAHGSPTPNLHGDEIPAQGGGSQLRSMMKKILPEHLSGIGKFAKKIASPQANVAAKQGLGPAQNNVHPAEPAVHPKDGPSSAGQQVESLQKQAGPGNNPKNVLKK
ncbi:hypothetical protein JXB31_05715 [Candidatus Woesearchaeota archaeon]|nr:hypothetical protein [Candidatus Woesearchaeota archaeon]